MDWEELMDETNSCDNRQIEIGLEVSEIDINKNKIKDIKTGDSSNKKDLRDQNVISRPKLVDKADS